MPVDKIIFFGSLNDPLRVVASNSRVDILGQPSFDRLALIYVNKRS